mmetsp:Transcript_62056/g.134658  ORF Transcript_62056/g.134658 Transcript_62056/m.134658 type:complete len:357 (-) Transcript_62056:139-1209(-)
MSTWSGTAYEGPEKNEWFEGKGTFRFPNGVVYEGEFRKGEFHGDGALVYPNGGRFLAQWDRGYAVEGRYEFNDGLLYEDRNWQYVSQGDRRFYTEVLHGLQPAGQTLLTNEPEPPKIPKGTFDTGNGFYDTTQGMILSYDGKDVLDYPGEVEERWIKEHCRKGFQGDADRPRPALVLGGSGTGTADATPAPTAPADVEAAAPEPVKEAPKEDSSAPAGSEEAKEEEEEVTSPDATPPPQPATPPAEPQPQQEEMVEEAAVEEPGPAQEPIPASPSAVEAQKATEALLQRAASPEVEDFEWAENTAQSVTLEEALFAPPPGTQRAETPLIPEEEPGGGQVTEDAEPPPGVEEDEVRS